MKKIRDEVKEHRKPGNEIDPLFVNRWSPRSMTGEKVDRNVLMSLFEAARWAPSSYNNQSWRFVYEVRDGDRWEEFVGLLGDFNRKWATGAGALVVICSKKTFDSNGEPSRTHSFDTGAAWENMALEGARRGLVVHGMEGFDYDAAREKLGVPEEFDVEAMVAVGKRAPKEELPEDLQERKFPKGRKSLDEIVFQERME